MLGYGLGYSVLVRVWVMVLVSVRARVWLKS